MPELDLSPEALLLTGASPDAVGDLPQRARLLSPGRQPNPAPAFVLYWCQMNRRADANHALLYAAAQANRLGLPLLVYEALTCTYEAANDRLHTFVLQGVAEMRRRVQAFGAGYCFYLRRRKADANNVLYRLAEQAALLVTDDYPTFIALQHNRSVPAKLSVPMVAVDSSCVVPMNRYSKREWAAYTIRPKIHKMLRDHLQPPPVITLQHRWPTERFAPLLAEWDTPVAEADVAAAVATCEIDHTVKPSLAFTGGRLAAEKTLHRFLTQRFSRYGTERNSPSNHATSNLSPYLHFGMISSLEVALAAEGYAAQHHLSAAELLEELIVRRELAFNFTRFTPDFASLSCLPDWVHTTLRKHQEDRRDYLYTYEQFENAETHDPLWNACQQEMRLRGKIHGYYRMYWGKKIIEWSATYDQALTTMLAIHDKYALDGRDPNTYTGVLWCFGLHDRPWGERKVFGTLRYMSFDGMKRKTNIEAYQNEIAYLLRTGKELVA